MATLSTAAHVNVYIAALLQAAAYVFLPKGPVRHVVELLSLHLSYSGPLLGFWVAGTTRFRHHCMKASKADRKGKTTASKDSSFASLWELLGPFLQIAPLPR